MSARWKKNRKYRKHLKQRKLVKRDEPMLSLQNTYNIKDLESWYNKVNAQIKQPKSSQGGFALVGVMISLVLASLILAAALQVQLGATRSVGKNVNRVRAQYVAQTGVALTAQVVASQLEAGETVYTTYSGDGYVVTITQQSPTKYRLDGEGFVADARSVAIRYVELPAIVNVPPPAPTAAPPVLPGHCTNGHGQDANHSHNCVAQ